MQKLETEVPDDLMRELAPCHERVGELLALGLQQMKIAEALMLYQRGWCLLSVPRR